MDSSPDVRSPLWGAMPAAGPVRRIPETESRDSSPDVRSPLWGPERQTRSEGTDIAKREEEVSERKKNDIGRREVESRSAPHVVVSLQKDDRREIRDFLRRGSGGR